MQNPFEQTQRSLLSRIISNVERLNQSVVTLNQELSILNSKNQQLCNIATICDHYQESLQFNISTNGQLKPPSEG